MVKPPHYYHQQRHRQQYADSDNTDMKREISASYTHELSMLTSSSRSTSPIPAQPLLPPRQLYPTLSPAPVPIPDSTRLSAHPPHPL